jgi:heparosan-N-sulfate-glucuronate 5-epimerase
VTSILMSVRRALRQDDYWHGERVISSNYVPGQLAGYPNDLSAKTLPYPGPVNEVGVPLFDYGRGIGPRLHPVTLCQVALGWHERWLHESAPAHRVRFLRLADWLVEHQQPRRGGGGGWPVDVDKRLYRLRAPWPSALVQGQALSVLARAANIEPARSGYREALEAGLVLFEVDASRGGVRTEDADGVGYEEYPSPSPSLVLNGLISALWGLADAALLLPAGRAARLFQDGAEALLRRLPRYDTGFWSRYCLFDHLVPNVASPYYHREHIAQLRAMARLMPDQRWEQTAQRWHMYQSRRLNRGAALSAKAVFRLLTPR